MYYLGIVLAIICVIIGIYKVKYPFWSKQPVFHYHNLKYWMFPPGIIQHDKPEKNKFYNEKIEFSDYFSLSHSKKLKFVYFIRKNFMPHKHECYNPPKNGVLNYFKNHNDKSYISLKMENNKILGCMSTRPLVCFIKNNKMDLHYVDFLCVDSKHRKKGIAPEVIYSHYLNHRNKHKSVVFLFKREGAKTLIVPLTTYYNYMFDITYWDRKVRFDEPTLNSILITKNNMYLLNDVWDRLVKSKKFECMIIPNLNHIVKLINDTQLYVSVTMIDKESYDLFFFRNSYTSYNGKKAIECICSYNETDDSVFTISFLSALSQIREIEKIGKVFIENIGDNTILLKKILARYYAEQKIETSYYFYNFGYRPFMSDKVFMLN